MIRRVRIQLDVECALELDDVYFTQEEIDEIKARSAEDFVRWSLQDEDAHDLDFVIISDELLEEDTK